MGFTFGSNKSSAKDLTPVEFSSQRHLISQQLQDRLQGNVNEITGPFAAPLSGAERGGLTALNNNAFGQFGVGGASDEALRIALAGGQQNPFLGDAITAAIDPILNNAELQQLRDRSNFTQAGQKIQGSSAFAEDRFRHLQETEANIANTAASLAFQDAQQRSQNQLQAVSLSNARLQEQREAISALALPRLIEQAGITGANTELARRFKVIEDALGLLSQLTSPTPVTTSSGFSGGVDGLDTLGGFGGN